MFAKFLHEFCKKEIKQILRLNKNYIFIRKNASQFLDKYVVQSICENIV